MSFSYSDDIATDRDRVRFNIRDVEFDEGPLPAAANFSNEEIDGLVTIEGTWQRATAAAFEALASAWAVHPTFFADGMSSSQSHIAQRYDAEAKRWRQMYGYGGASSSGVVASTRIDGYSSDVTNEDIDGEDYTSAEYLL